MATQTPILPTSVAPQGRQRWTFDLVPDGSGATVVTEIYDCSRSPDDARVSMDNGRIWIDSMTMTLKRLEDLCAE